MSDEYPTIGDYYITNTIGLGSTAKVKLGKHKVTGEKVAIKIIKKKLFDQKPDLSIKLQREIAVMRVLNHPNLLKFINFYESEKYVYLILELGSNGELYDLLVDNGPPSASYSLKFFREIVYGLDFLHTHNICHRDIKPENILLSSCYNVKIADFGFARFLKSNAAETSCGSPHYAAPEVIKAQPYDGKAADVWSVGVVLYTLLTGRRPFEDKSVKNLLQKIKNADYQMPDLPPDVQDIIAKMLTVNPSERITISEIKKHPAFHLLLPEGYVVPQPLPNPEVPEPLDVSKINPEILQQLCKLDDDTEEHIKAQLAADHHTLEKENYVFITKLLSFDFLPWGEKKPGPIEATTNVIRSSETFSLENPTPTVAINTLKMEGIGIPLTKTDNEIQKCLTKAGYAWFFPDELTFYARHCKEESDVSISLNYSDEKVYDLEFNLIKGSPELFNSTFQEIEANIKAIVDAKK